VVVQFELATHRPVDGPHFEVVGELEEFVRTTVEQPLIRAVTET